MNNFLKDFAEEEKSLLEEPAWLIEKHRDIEKREKEEMKRLEKQVFKKDAQEVDEAYANNNLKLLREKVLKSINENVVKQQKQLTKI